MSLNIWTKKPISLSKKSKSGWGSWRPISPMYSRDCGDVGEIKFLVFGLFGVRTVRSKGTVRSCSVFELFAQSWLWSSTCGIYNVYFRVKLLNGGAVNHYWPITPTYQILCITDPDLAHFLLNLRPIFKYQRLRLSLRAPSNQNQFETPTKSRSSKKSRVFKRAVRRWSKWIFTWIGLWWRKILAD